MNERRQLRAAGVPAPQVTKLEKIAAEVATLKRDARRMKTSGDNVACLWCGAVARHEIVGDHDMSGHWCRKCLVELTACRLKPTEEDIKAGRDSRAAWPGRIARAARMLDEARLRREDDDDGPRAA